MRRHGECLLRRAGITEAAASYRNAATSRRDLDVLVRQDTPVANQIEGDRAAASGEITRSVHLDPLAQPGEPIEQRVGAGRHVAGDGGHAEAPQPT